MSKTSYFSYDIDTGDVVAKTDIQNDGTVNRYTYTEPDNIRIGHGDAWYNTVEDFMNDNPSGSRDKDDPASIGRDWKGNGHIFNTSNLDEIIGTVEEEVFIYTKKLKRY